MTSYQKLKQENKALHDIINTLVLRPDSVEASIIIDSVRTMDTHNNFVESFNKVRHPQTSKESIEAFTQ